MASQVHQVTRIAATPNSFLATFNLRGHDGRTTHKEVQIEKLDHERVEAVSRGWYCHGDTDDAVVAEATTCGMAAKMSAMLANVDFKIVLTWQDQDINDGRSRRGR